MTAWSDTLALVPTPKCFMISYLWDFTGFMENFGMVPNPWAASVGVILVSLTLTRRCKFQADCRARGQAGKHPRDHP